MRRGLQLIPVVTVVALAVLVAGSFLPWFRSGRRARSSYQLFDLVDRLDLLESTTATVAVTGWLLVPLVAAGAVATILLGWLRLGGVLASVAGLYTALLASIVSSSTSRWEAGTAVATIGGIVATLGGLTLLAGTRRPRRQQAASP